MAITENTPYLSAFTDNVDRSTYTLTAWTPTANTAFTLFVTLSGFTGTPTISGGSGWAVSPALSTSATWNSGASTLHLFWGVAGASPGSFTPSIGASGGATGCIAWPQEWSGCDLTTPIKQTKVKNSTTGSNPTITFDATTISTSGIAMAIACAANPPTITCDANLAEECDAGHTSPTSGLEVAENDSGLTLTTLTATRSSINHGIVAVEIQVPIVAGTKVSKLMMMGMS